MVETIQPIRPPNFLNNRIQKSRIRATICRHAISEQSLLPDMNAPLPDGGMCPMVGRNQPRKRVDVVEMSPQLLPSQGSHKGRDRK